MKRFLILALALIILLFSGFNFLSCSRKDYSITLAYSPFESMGLVWIAEERHFFKQNGINLTSIKYDTGVGALDSMINGEADMAAGANEFPLVGRAFQEVKISTIGSIAKSEFIYIVARKDRGIEKPSDLKGKVIGTTLRTIAEFYLGRFLELNGMSMKDVSVVNLKTPAEWVDAVVNGDIDAVVTAQPYASEAKNRLGENATSWSAQSSQPLYTQLIATHQWINDNHELINYFLQALLEAETYIIRNPSSAKDIMQENLKIDASYMETVWSQNQFGLSLEQSLILAMEDESRWMITNNVTEVKQVPNFLDYIYEDGLKKIKPEAVDIIR